MIKLFLNLWLNWRRKQQFKSALRKNQRQKAFKLLEEIINSGAKLSLTETLFHKQIKLEQLVDQHKRINHDLVTKINVLSAPVDQGLLPDAEAINYLRQELKITAHDSCHLQITGIDQIVFDDLEKQIYDYLEEEFDKYKENPAQLNRNLQLALKDINNLKQGKDPAYNQKFTPHVYLMKYFLDNTYTIYLAWLLIYEFGLLPQKFTLLDLAAGPSTTAYGLDLLYRSLQRVINLRPLHLSYFSIEQRETLQYRGLQLWRRYMASQTTPNNTYFQFLTGDIFNLENWLDQIPKNFFDFIVISHCFFSDPQKRHQSVKAYQEIFQNCLVDHGYVLLIIQDKKLFKTYNIEQTNNIEDERNAVKNLLNDLDLNLVWYRYLSSTPNRELMERRQFGTFANSNLPKQKYISDLLQKYVEQKFTNHYTLDDYIILGTLNQSNRTSSTDLKQP